MQPGLKSRDLGVICIIHIWRDPPNPGPNSRDLGIIWIHLCRDHPNPGPKSGLRITGGGSYVTVCLVTLTTIPLARISPFPLVPSNAGIICSNSASASLVSSRPSIPAGHVDITSYVTTCQNWRSNGCQRRFPVQSFALEHHIHFSFHIFQIFKSKLCKASWKHWSKENEMFCSHISDKELTISTENLPSSSSFWVGMVWFSVDQFGFPLLPQLSM